MLKYVDYDIVFQEIPDEVSLAINLSNCPHRCEGCHSPQLQSDIGEPLNENVITELLEKYGDGITCVCFMGGDSAPDEVCRLAEFIRLFTNNKIKTAWYSGCKVLNTDTALHSFNYIKLVRIWNISDHLIKKRPIRNYLKSAMAHAKTSHIKCGNKIRQAIWTLNYARDQRREAVGCCTNNQYINIKNDCK